MSTPNCYHALEGLNEAISSQLDHDQRYVVVGGVVTGAIKHEGTTFHHAGSRLMPTSMKSAEPVIRDNGTVRDVDVVVLDRLSEEQGLAVKAAMKSSIIKAVGQEMVVSVFGFDERQEMTRERRVQAAMKAWTSKRTVDEYGVHRYELYPIEKVVSPESYQSWDMLTPNGATVPVLNPLGHMLAYRMRSISGLRTKDAEKVSEMKDRIMGEEEFVQGLGEGPFVDWAEFADGLEALREDRFRDYALLTREGAKLSEIVAANTKSRGLAWIEGNKKIVDFAQKDWMQKILNFSIGAR